MALAYRTSAAGGSSSGTGSRTVTFTPALNDLIVVCVAWAASAFPTLTDNQGGTYTCLEDDLGIAVAAQYLVYIRDSRMGTTSSTTITAAGTNDAGELVVVAISGMPKYAYGRNAVKNFHPTFVGGEHMNWSFVIDNAPNSTFVTLQQSALTGNMTIGMVGNASNPAGMTTPSGWTERQDVGQNNPSIGLEVVTRDSGFTGTTITWGNTSATASKTIGLELEAFTGIIAERGKLNLTTGSPPITTTLRVSMPAAVGTFTHTGQATTLAVKIPADQGSFTETGQAATLTYTPAAASWSATFDTDAGHYTVSGHNVTQWTDQTNTNHLVPASSSVGPLDNVSTTPSGHVAFDFNGTSHELHSTAAMSNFIGGGAYTFFMVVRIDSAAHSNALYYQNDPLWMDVKSDFTDYGYTGVYAKSNNDIVLGNFDTNEDTATSTFTPGKWMVVQGRHESGTIYFQVGRGTEFSAASGLTAVLTNVLYLFFNARSANNWYTDGAVACFEISKDVLSSTDRATELTRLLDKYINRLAVSVGTFTHTGQATTLAVKIPADQGSFTETGQSATLTKQSKITAAVGSFSETGQNVTLAVTLPVSNGSFTETGQAVTFRRTLIFSASVGTFTETGVAVTFDVKLPVSVGSFTESGQNVGLTAQRKLSVSAGSFALTGQDSTLCVTIPANTGTFIETGESANLLAARIFHLSAGSFAETGNSAVLDVAIYPTTATYTLTGISASILAQRKLVCSVGSFILSGQDVSILATRQLAVADGSFSLTSPDVVLDTAIPANVGSFTLTGQSISTSITRNLSCGTGSFSLTGQSVDILAQRKLSVNNASFSLTANNTVLDVTLPVSEGTFTLSGNDINTSIGRAITAETGTFTLAGQSVGLMYTPAGAFAIFANAGTFAETGESVKFHQTRTAGTGTFALSASTIRFDQIRLAGTGTFTSTGQDTSLLAQFKVLASTGAFQFTGNSVSFADTMPAGVGMFTLTGVNAGIAPQRKLSVDAESFSLTGIAAALSKTSQIIANTASYILTGNDVSLRYGANTNFLVDRGLFTLTGNDVGLTTGISPFIVTSAGIFTLGGTSANLLPSRKLSLDYGKYRLRGRSAGKFVRPTKSQLPKSIKVGSLTPYNMYLTDITNGQTSEFNLDSYDIRFVMVNKLTKEVKVNKPATIVDSINGVVKYQWESSDVNTVGSYLIVVKAVDYTNNKVRTFPDLGYLRLDITP